MHMSNDVSIGVTSNDDISGITPRNYGIELLEYKWCEYRRGVTSDDDISGITATNYGIEVPVLKFFTHSSLLHPFFKPYRGMCIAI